MKRGARPKNPTGPPKERTPVPQGGIASQMELSINKQELLSGLAATQGIIEKRNTMPILANVLLEAHEGGLVVVATDLEIGVRLEVEAKVASPGKITVPARKLFELVRELPDEAITLKGLDNNRVEISVGSFRSEIAGLPADEYPNLPSYEEGKFFKLDSTDLSEMLQRTVYAVSTDETRYNLNGIYFERVDGGKKLRLVATDGHRLALTDRELQIGKAWGERGLIVPRKAITELRKLLDNNESVELSFQKNHGIARTGNTILLMTLIDGEFPKYDQVIPKGSDKELVVPRENFIAAIRRVFPVTDERSHMVKLRLTPSEVAIEADSQGVGQASTELSGEYNGKETLTIGFNARYLLDALGVLSSDKVSIKLIDEVNPATLQGVEEQGTLSVVMPMRI